MTAIGFLSGDFVRRTGDTMTGNLTVNASIGVTGLGTFGTQVSTPLVTSALVDTTDLEVNDDADVAGDLTANFQGVTGNVMQFLASVLSTGVTSGGEFIPNVDPTKLDITATTGWIVNYNSSAPFSPTNPSLIHVSIPAQIGLTPIVGVPTGVTYWLADSAGTIIQQATQPTPTQRRTHLVLGATFQSSGVIVVDQTLPVIQSQPLNQLVDLMDALGNFNISGNKVSPNGANLTFNKQAGIVFARAFSQVPEYTDPHHSDLAAQTPTSFRRLTAVSGSSGPVVTTMDVGNYDPNGTGVVTPIPGGANVATNFRVWGFASNNVVDQIFVQYGQSTYASLAAAVAAIGTTSFIPNPSAADAGVLIGWISVIRTATNLSDPAQATFTSPVGRFPTP